VYGTPVAPPTGLDRTFPGVVQAVLPDDKMTQQASARKLNSPIVIPVLGMHRSGTSMLTGALRLLGLDLGTPLLEPTPDNPEGYWENEFFVRINAELLRTMQCDEDGFGPYPMLTKLPKLCERIIVEPYKVTELRTFIEATFSSSVWGWKDPRTVLTFDVWQRVLMELGFRDVRPVVLVRHPAGVVRSLVQRVQRNPANKIPADQLAAMATEIWLAYHQILWQRCLNQNWFVGTYESFVDRQLAKCELIRLAEYCGLDESRVGMGLDAIQFRNVETPAEMRATMNSGTSGDLSSRSSMAIRLYHRFQQIVRTVCHASSTDPLEALLIKAEPDERRLLQRADEFRKAGRIEAAVDLLRKGLEIRPQYRAARFMLGTTLMETGHITQSAEHAGVLVKANRHDPIGHGLWAFGLTQQARISEAMAAFRECIRCLPKNSAAWSNLLFTSLYADQLDAKEVTQVQREGGRAIAQIATGQRPAIENTTCHGCEHPDFASPMNQGTHVPRSPWNESSVRVLRVGYLSGDLKKHPVGYFMRAILQHRDRSQMHTICYHVGEGNDELTQLLQSNSDSWCVAHKLSDDELWQRIRHDNIDLLIDLCGHTAGNRAAVITRRAAPVQAMYLGYPCTSGLPNMDFVITDHHVSPPEFADLYTEKVQRLDNCFLCFHPHDDAPPVASAPCEKNGFVTFGSFNNLPKISPTTVRLWSEILHAVPDARLVLKALSFVDAQTREVFHEQFMAQGIELERVDLLPPTVPLSRFLNEYRRIDIALDPLPYNGGTTTCEALWMGVPVITLPGQHFFSRMGLSILKTLGLNDWIAESARDYVRIAVGLSGDHRLLAEYRTMLRPRLFNSPICDGAGFTRGLEAAYRAILQK
jgi:protein O-GlcNAc transferase